MVEGIQLSLVRRYGEVAQPDLQGPGVEAACSAHDPRWYEIRCGSYAALVRYVLLLVAVFAIAAPTSATTTARELRVTAGTDGAPGSLRQLVEQVARPGDSIVFPTALRVELRRKLTIPRRLAGLTIDGSTSTGGTAEIVGVRSAGGTFVEVTADAVTLRRLKLTSLPVVFRSRTVGAGGPMRRR